MKEKCPGLPDWHALLEAACAEAFSTPDTAPNGRYLGGPVTWEGFDDERVVALKLPFTVVHAGTDGAMFAELDSAYQRQAPIMLWVYSPHWAPAKYEGEWVEFPEHTPECYTDPKWGTNPDAQYDCGKPHGEIWKYAWAGMKDKWPVAYKVAKNYTIDAAELNKLSGEVDLEGKIDRRRGGRLDRRERSEVEGLGAIIAGGGGARARPAGLPENLVSREERHGGCRFRAQSKRRTHSPHGR